MTTDQAFQAFLASRGMTPDSPILDRDSFLRDWERFLFLSRPTGGGVPKRIDGPRTDNLIQQVWYSFLQNRGLTEDSPIDDPAAFTADWEGFLFASSAASADNRVLMQAPRYVETEPVGSPLNPIRVTPKYGGY